MPAVSIRPANADDLDALVALEERVFATDRLSRRSLRRFIANPRDSVLVATDEAGAVAGYALVLFRESTALARLYSIAVASDRVGQGFGRALLAAAERAAVSHGCVFLRLEVRADNAAAVGLYEKRGYRRFGRYAGYYQDKMDALRYEKRLAPDLQLPQNPPPYFEQSLDFTCGPACILMALAWADPAIKPSRVQELRLWREATTIYMTSGLGGCEPYGLAVTLARRGLRPEIRVSHEGPFFLDSVRSEEKREVMRLAQEDFREASEALDIPLTLEPLTGPSLCTALDEGAIAIVLVSGYRMFAKKVPHWVLAHGHHGGYIFVNDPWVEDEDFETAADAANLPIPVAQFERMARYGRDNLRAAVLIRKDKTP